MGYSITLDSIYNVQEFLDVLLRAKESTTIFKTNNPTDLSYRLRQAQVVAKRLEHEPYNELDYIFKVAESTVICVRKAPIYPTIVKAIVNEGVPHPEVRKMEEVVSVCITENCTMTFSNYTPKEEELLILNEWGKEAKYEFYISDDRLVAKYNNA